eukprot:CAMPEP_0180146554 /NCGR_PEP_ID=MMETSP0986-20121125/18581_1 /TAXON_ID=697907 /ORGANISM="non described non described, Strain CCMP2293" /LENGTH=148 /DNA_ID=CAMNT_0022091637 /DNA_START=144 /DNA_END=591 /DNA_ORIENTATION=-
MTRSLRASGGTTPDHRVLVALELLHDLLCLHIPHVHALVLRSRHHPPVRPRDGEGRDDAELLVGVPRVRLQALARGVVPEAELVVEAPRQDELRVGRERHERHWGVIVVDETLEALACRRVPDAAQPVEGAGDDEGAVAVELDGRDRV